MYEHLKIEERGMVAIMTISAPKSLNALNSTILKEIGEYLDEFDTHRFRCLIITGDGEKSFVAGADISEMATLGPQQGEYFGKCGANGIFGLEYKFNAPVALQFDFRPGYGCLFAENYDFHYFDWSVNLGVRYTF